jgi:uridine kinase
MEPARPDLTAVTALAAQRRSIIGLRHSLMVGLSGIDGAGKGFVAAKLEAELRGAGLRVASINVDGWLNLPSVRFSKIDPAEHFYYNALRLDAMFSELVLPLRRHRTHRVTARLAEETARTYHEHLYEFENIDVVLLEGIFLYKRAYRAHFDVACWVDCTFETALKRAVRRSQEGLPREETVSAYQTIYFPAQRLHFERDEPLASADLVLRNDPRLEEDAAPSPAQAR